MDAILNGRHIKGSWSLEDWIVGGGYYDGRHKYLLLTTSYHSPLSQTIRKDYQVRYFVRNKRLPKVDLFVSIESIKNKIYDNPSISIWDMEKKKGRS